MSTTMTDTLTPIHIGDRIHNLPSDLAGSIALTRQRMDAAKKAEEYEDDEEMEDEPDDESEEAPSGKKMSMKEKMAALRAKKDSGDEDEYEEYEDEYDSDDSDEIADHEDSLEEAIMETITRMDAMEDEYETEEDPMELAMGLINAYEQSKPFLPAGTTFQSLTATDEDGDGIFDAYDIYSVAVMTQYPEIDIDISNDDEVYGAFQMMLAVRSPMTAATGSSLESSIMMDSADSDSDGDRLFSQQLGLRSDSDECRPIGSVFKLKPLY